MPLVTPDQALVATAASVMSLPLDPSELPAVTRHLALLLSFADTLGEATPEPAPVYIP